MNIEESTNPFDIDTVTHSVSHQAIVTMLNTIEIATKSGAFGAADLLPVGYLVEHLLPFAETTQITETTQTN